jgi:hypothetical protein
MKRVASLALLMVILSGTVSPVFSWSIERPLRPTGSEYALPPFSDSVSSDGNASVGLGVNPASLVTNDHTHHGGDTILLNVSMTANSRENITYQCYNESATDVWIPLHGGDNYTTVSNVGNDTGFWVDMNAIDPGFMFRFWGGAGYRDYPTGSGEYSKVWVCTNGFLAFDNSNFTGHVPTTIPNSADPRAIIAAVWSQLSIDSQSSIEYGYRYNQLELGETFYVTWLYALDVQSGRRLSFQIQLQKAPGPLVGYIKYGQSELKIVWLNVANINTNYAFGFDDQEGLRGYGGLCLGSTLGSRDGVAYYYEQTWHSSNYYLQNLALRFNDTSPTTTFYFDNDPLNMRGNNINIGGGQTQDTDARFAIATSGIQVGLSHYGGLFFAGLFFFAGVGNELSRYYYPAAQTLSIMDQNNIPRGAYVQVGVPNGDLITKDGSAVDADMGFVIYWVLDPGSRNVAVTLTVTAELDYYELKWDGSIGQHYHVNTSVNLTLEPDSPTYANNNSFANATQIQEGQYSYRYLDQYYDTEDFYKITVDTSRSIQAHVDIDAKGIPKDFYLYLWNSSEGIIWSSENGFNQSQDVFGKQLNSPGDWYIEAKAAPSGEYGFYNLTVKTAFMCDVNFDGVVNILDAILLANSFGTNRGDPQFNPNADFNWDGSVNILDAITLANNFGHVEQVKGQSIPAGKSPSPNTPSQKGIHTLTDSATLSLSPTQTVVFKGETFNVSVNIAGVTNLVGWEFKLYWNNTALNCTNASVVTPTEWQGNTQDDGPGLQANYNSTNGRFWKAEAANYPAPPFNGSMTIATLTFQAMQPGTTSLTLADTILGDSTAQPINCSVSSGSVTVYSGRYMRSDTQTINGLNAYNLNVPESTSSASCTKSGSGEGASWGIRAFVRHSNGTEQEISLDGQTGTPAAVVYREFYSGIESATVNVSQTALQSTDSLVIRTYIEAGSSGWVLSATFTTEQLNATTLQAATWTLYYYTLAYYNRRYDWTTATLYWGTTTYNTRIQNLQYT